MRTINHRATRRNTSRHVTIAALGLALSLSLAACGSDDDDDPSTSANGEPSSEPADAWNPDIDAEVTISYSNLPPTENAESRANAERVAQEFMDLYPNVTLEGEETIWEAQTFNAMLAGGTLPTVMRIPFPQMPGIMNREQAANITDAVAENEFLSGLNPGLMERATDANGRIRGIPMNAYSFGLTYNRDVFEQAGLDPDDPPETWDEVREYAKTITDETGIPGFLMMTTEIQGGWNLTGLSYAFGAQLEEPDGESYTVTANNEATLQALDFLKAMRWEDDSLGDNFLLTQSDIRDEMAAGRVGMFLGGANSYFDLVTNRGMPPEQYGLASLPQDDDGLGTLAGGNFELISPDATQEEIYWGLKWIEYRHFRIYIDEETAVANAKATAADGLPVGNPQLPRVNQELQDRHDAWIEEYINVPRENYSHYLATVESLPLVPEPPAKGAELYAALDPVVQAVLTREDADPAQMLDQVSSDVNALIAQDG